jgi:phosphoglycerate dehydrogenase-like enzyme
MTNDALTVVIASPLEPEHVETIRAFDSRLNVLYDPALLPPMRYVTDHGGDPNWQRTPEQEQQFLAMLRQADVLFDFPRGHTRNLPDVAPRVKWVQATSAGIGQTVKNAGLDTSGIVFTTASGVHARPLADFCLMAMLMFSKNFVHMEAERRARRWAHYCGEELTGKTLAIVGLGRIGAEVASHGKKQDMRVVGMKRTPSEVPNVDKIYARNELPEMLAEADFLVIIAPHTPETAGMIGEREIAAMKPGAVLINIARGTLVDEDALIRALQEGRLGGAALDVVRTEPLPADSPLWEMPNVILCPHSGSAVLQENGRIAELFCDNLSRYMSGQPLRNVLDTDRLY